MAIERKIELFLQSVRAARKKIFTTHVVVSVASVAVILLFTVIMLFGFYSYIAEQNYKNILYDIYRFQNQIIHRQSYLHDIEEISEYLKGKPGVLSVWVADRNGRCQYHTDKNFLKQYRGNYFPPEYYENIRNVWTFQGRFPEIKSVKIKGILAKRLSIPLYPFSKANYDFILGIDIKRFPFIPGRLQIIAIFIAAYFIIFSSIVFFSVWLVLRGKLEEITTQAMILAGSLGREKAEVERQESEEEEEPVEEEEGITGKEKMAKEEAKATESEDTAKEELVKKQEKEAISKKLEKTESESPQILFMEYKQKYLKKVEEEYFNSKVSLYPFHSKSPNGYYVTSIKGEKIDWYTMFSFEDVDLGGAENRLKEFIENLAGISQKTDNVKNFLIEVDRYCEMKKIVMDFSLLGVKHEKQSESENEGTAGDNSQVKFSGIEYSSLGRNYALYVKSDERDIKELYLSLPRAGEVGENAESVVEYAEINFSGGDVFIMLPGNSIDFKLDDDSLDAVVRTVVTENLDNRDLIGSTIEEEINRLRRKNRDLPETGLIVANFK